jgi:5-formyltetrahydrofolate cyclo-ligase
VTAPPGAVVSGYMPMADELDVLVALEHFHRHGHACCLPVVIGRGRPLLFRLWRPGEALAAGPMGVREPSADSPEATPSLLLVPLLAFDRSGNRIGYGAGFYDMTLARLRAAGPILAVGVAYAGQEAQAVPAGPGDEPLDLIVTEREAIPVAGRPR